MIFFPKGVIRSGWTYRALNPVVLSSDARRPDDSITMGIQHLDGGDELKDVDERDQQIVALRNLLAKLSEASLRINESLDFDTVLQGILDSARSLTNARCGVIVSVDDKGQAEDFLASGLTDDETQQLFAMPEGLKVFEHLTTIPGPLRIPDLTSFLKITGPFRVPPAH